MSIVLLSKTDLLAVVGSIFLSCLMVTIARADSGSSRPNVVYILSDDVGWGDLSVHGGGVPTPNIDRLFSQSVEMTQFMGWCVCSPTRAMLLTGRHPIRVGTGPEVGGELALDDFRLRAGVNLNGKPEEGADGFNTAFTLGAGVRGESFFLDLGYRRNTGDGSVQPYAGAPLVTTDNTASDIVLTLGFKF